MYERDLELGPLSPRPSRGPYGPHIATSQSSASSETLWTASYERADPGRDGLCAIAEKDTPDRPDRSHEPEDEDYVKLPRQKLSS